jgi:cytochrome c553
MKKTIAIALLAAGSFATSALAADVPLEKIKEKAKTCAACHGEDGNATANPMYPRLAGQYHDYLSRALHEYKNGERKNPIMAGFAGALTAKDIEDLSAYYASQPPVLLRKY